MMQRLAGSQVDRLFAPGTGTSLQVSHTALDSPFLRLLASNSRDLLARVMTQHSYAKGEIVVREGEPGDSMYIIWSGWVAVFRGDVLDPVVLGYRGPGEIIGEMALVEDEPRSASIIALQELRLLKITRLNFQQLLNINPSVGMGMLRIISSRLRAADDVRATITHTVSELRSEKEQLQALERLRQETTDLIVHDLRNPLAVIVGMIQMLRMVLPEEVVKQNEELLQMADNNAQRLQNLVDSMLSVARMEQGAEDLNLEAVNLARMIQEATGRVAPFLKRYNITMRAVAPDDLPAVMADETKLDRVLGNLIDNAMKYTQENGKITVMAEVGDQEVKVSVMDTGPGVPEEYREAIFGRFSQVPGDKPRRRGFGLGLTFCQLVVAAHGGRIWVEPGENGVGSQFVFTLPL
jgi:signal transduction histidine kinase